MIRLVTVLTAIVFFVSAVLNFGAKIPLGLGELSFSAPLTSTGLDELVIGLVLIAAAAMSRLYVYGAHTPSRWWASHRACSPHRSRG